jgi:hypothetical protein
MKTNNSIEILKQLSLLLKKLDSTQYSEPLSIFNGSSIGGHVRHVIEFYECLLGSSETQTVSYGARKRDLQIEQNINYAIACIDLILAKLSQKMNNECDLQIQFETDEGQIVSTTFEREEIYLVEHSIHHFAIIRIGVQANFPNIIINKDFGVAFSTIQHRKKQQELSCAS